MPLFLRNNEQFKTRGSACKINVLRVLRVDEKFADLSEIGLKQNLKRKRGINGIQPAATIMISSINPQYFDHLSIIDTTDKSMEDTLPRSSRFLEGTEEIQTESSPWERVRTLFAPLRYVVIECVLP